MTVADGQTILGSDPGLASLFGQLIEDGREVAHAEVALVKARVGNTVSRYRNAVVYLAIAGVLALAGLIALLVGLIFTLAIHVGPGLATLIVVGAVMVAAAIFGMVGKGRLTPGDDA